MLYKKSLAPTLTKEQFQNPDMAYRGAPFWSWNCDVTEEMVLEQAEIYKKMGMGGFHIHARTGLETPYMGEKFMDLVALANEWAKKQGMYVYLYDEDRYPSGAAGGIVTENVRYRQRHLYLTTDQPEEFLPDRASFEAAIDRGEAPRGYYLTSYEIALDEDGCLASYRQVDREYAAKRSAAAGKIWNAYLRLAPEDPWFNDKTYIDVFNKEAVETFIKVTHERYYEKLGKDFGGSIPSIFTDEPQMAGAFSFATPFDDQYGTIPYTDDMDDTYRAAYGVGLLEILPEILWQLPDGKISVHRYHFHDHRAERFASAFSDTIAKWCGEHHIAMTGHYMSERTLFAQVLALSDSMRLYRNMQMPGLDILIDNKEITTAKQAVSVARQMGREGVTCEEYGSTHWNWDFKGHKLQGDWLAALGVTLRVHHLTFMSMEGESKRDWPASIGYQSPWYLKYPYVEDHFARLNTVLTRGQADVKVGVLYPMESYWLYYGPNSQTQTIRDQMDANYENMMQWLLYGTIDFDLINESLLPGQCPPESIFPGNALDGNAPDGKESVGDGGVCFPVGKMAYDVIVVPDLVTIRGTTLDRLEAFAAAGGKVVFAGTPPTHVDALPSDRARKLAEKCVNCQMTRADLLNALEDNRTVKILDAKGMLSGNLMCQVRKDNDCTWLFVCHVNRKGSQLEKREKYQIYIKGRWQAELYDTITGEITPVTTFDEGAFTRIKRFLFAEDSILLRLTPGEPRRESPQKLPHGTSHWIRDIGAYSLSEPNALLLDYAQYRLDGGEWQPRKDILTIDNEVRKALGLPRRQDRFTQPWRLPKETPCHTVDMKLEFTSEIPVSGAKLAMERPLNAVIRLNGKTIDHTPDGWYVDKAIETVPLPEIREGVNVLELSIPFARRTNLEWCYILGDFGVRAAGTAAWICPASQKLYFGDTVHQGLPFYTGNITYRLTAHVEADAESVWLWAPHFAAPVMEASVDGENKGVIAYAPHKLQIGPLKAGTHEIEITAYGNRFNGFGTLHNADKGFLWYGPDSYRTAGSQWSDCYLFAENGILSPVSLDY